MNRLITLVLLPVSLVLLSYCAQLEQADPFRILRMSVRVYAPLHESTPSITTCNAVAANFILIAEPGPDNEAAHNAGTPTNNIPFDPIFSDDDPGTAAGPVQVVPPGCFLGRNVALTTGNWTIGFNQTTDLGNIISNAFCDVLITTDESTTNSPWAGFSANGEEFDTVGTTEGCVFEDVDLVTNVYP